MVRNYVCDDVGGFSVLTLGLFRFVASSVRYDTIIFFLFPQKCPAAGSKAVTGTVLSSA